MAYDKRFEGRAWVRIPYPANVVINGRVLVKAVDLSLGGMYLYTGRSYRAGSFIDISFPIGAETVALQAQVKFNKEGVGMGVQFVDVPEREKTHIAAFIKANLNHFTGGLEKKKILIFSEDRTAARIVQGILVSTGYSVFSTISFTDAMQYLASEREVDRVLILTTLEKATKFSTLKAILHEAAAKKIASLVVAPNTTPGTAGRILDLGATEFLPRDTANPKKICDVVQRLKSPAAAAPA